MACQTGLCTSVRECSRGCQVIEVHIAVFQQSYVGIGIQTTLTREEVGAVSLGFDVGREGVDRVFRQEMVDVQLVDAGFRIVGHQCRCQSTFGIEGDECAAFELHVALTFVQGHVC